MKVEVLCLWSDCKTMLQERWDCKFSVLSFLYLWIVGCVYKMIYICDRFWMNLSDFCCIKMFLFTSSIVPDLLQTTFFNNLYFSSNHKFFFSFLSLVYYISVQCNFDLRVHTSFVHPHISVPNSQIKNKFMTAHVNEPQEFNLLHMVKLWLLIEYYIIPYKGIFQISYWNGPNQNKYIQ